MIEGVKSSISNKKRFYCDFGLAAVVSYLTISFDCEYTKMN